MSITNLAPTDGARIISNFHRKEATNPTGYFCAAGAVETLVLPGTDSPGDSRQSYPPSHRWYRSLPSSELDSECEVEGIGSVVVRTVLPPRRAVGGRLPCSSSACARSMLPPFSLVRRNSWNSVDPTWVPLVSSCVRSCNRSSSSVLHQANL